MNLYHHTYHNITPVSQFVQGEGGGGIVGNQEPSDRPWNRLAQSPAPGTEGMRGEFA